MTVQEKPYPVVSLVVDTFGEWLKHRRELKEMREMDAANFGRIAERIADVFRRSGGAGPPGAACRRRAAEDAGRRSASTRRIWRGPSRSCCATWSASARCATTSASATAISPPAPPLRIMKSIAAMPTRSTASARG